MQSCLKSVVEKNFLVFVLTPSADFMLTYCPSHLQTPPSQSSVLHTVLCIASYVCSNKNNCPLLFELHPEVNLLRGLKDFRSSCLAQTDGKQL